MLATPGTKTSPRGCKMARLPVRAPPLPPRVGQVLPDQLADHGRQVTLPVDVLRPRTLFSRREPEHHRLGALLGRVRTRHSLTPSNRIPTSVYTWGSPCLYTSPAAAGVDT